MLLLNSQLVFAHPGRTNSEGCHTNHSTGTYHCHNGSGSGSSGNNYRDSEAYEKYKEEQLEKAYDEGFQYGINGKSIKSHYENYKKEYEESFRAGFENGQKLYELINEARRVGYKQGLETDDESIPSKYKEPENVYRAFFLALRNGQVEKWREYVEEKAHRFEKMALPSHLHSDVRSELRKIYDEIIERKAYEQGYSDAFKMETMIVPEQFEAYPYLKKQYAKGYENNVEISEYIEEAYESGKSGEPLEISNHIEKEGAGELYKKYYNKGKHERIEKYIFTFLGISISVVVIVLIYKLFNRIGLITLQSRKDNLMIQQ